MLCQIDGRKAELAHKSRGLLKKIMMSTNPDNK
jgi:hypothetical protein